MTSQTQPPADIGEMVRDLVLRAREYEAAVRLGGEFPAQAEKRLDKAKSALLTDRDDLVRKLGVAVETVFAEKVTTQAARLGVEMRQTDSPGKWFERVRKTALLAALKVLDGRE